MRYLPSRESSSSTDPVASVSSGTTEPSARRWAAQPVASQVALLRRASTPQETPITLRDLLDRLLRTRAGGRQNTVLMPSAGSGILKTWKPAGARTTACTPPWTCTT